MLCMIASPHTIGTRLRPSLSTDRRLFFYAGEGSLGGRSPYSFHPLPCHPSNTCMQTKHKENRPLLAGWPLLGTALRDSPYSAKHSVPRSTPGYQFLPPLGWVALRRRALCKLQGSTQTSHVATLSASNNAGLCTPS